MGTITLPSGKSFAVVPAEKVPVGAYRRMKKFDRLVVTKEQDEEAVINAAFELVHYLCPEIADEDLDALTINELMDALRGAITGVTREAGINPEPVEGAGAPKG
jgi:hypothetical protein